MPRATRANTGGDDEMAAAMQSERAAAAATAPAPRSRQSRTELAPEERPQIDEEFKLEQQRLRTLEALRHKEMADWWSKPRRKGELPPMRANALRRHFTDPSIPRNRSGEDVRETGFRYKNVPNIHIDGEPVKGEGGEPFLHLQDGYEFVKVDEDGNPDPNGKPMQNAYGLGYVMRIPTPEAARRAVARTPGGAFSPEEFCMAQMHGTAEQINRHFGQELLKVKADDDAGHYSEEVPFRTYDDLDD
jgi:hypothetical protein